MVLQMEEKQEEERGGVFLMNFIGLIVAIATFVIIGIFHPIVIKTEYYFGV